MSTLAPCDFLRVLQSRLRPTHTTFSRAMSSTVLQVPRTAR